MFSGYKRTGIYIGRDSDDMPVVHVACKPL